jgi:type IV pilus assembly protein PilY1
LLRLYFQVKSIYQEFRLDEVANMKRTGYVLTMAIAFLLCGLPAVSQAATQNDYCVQPSFVAASIPPNLLLYIDNSASMYDLQAIDNTKYCANALTISCTTDANCPSTGTCMQTPSQSCSTDATCSNLITGDKCNNKCNTVHYCYDDTYNNTADYEGYFSKTNSSGATVYPIYSYSGGKFVETTDTSVPTTGGTYRTSYLYLAMSGDGTLTPSSRKITTFKASGRFLNWLTASKFDVEKKILTGGKYKTDVEAGSDVLIGESRGCIGRRFVKQLPVSDFSLPVPSGGTITPGLTFAVRGPNALDPGFISGPTGGGTTMIEVYEKDYQKSACSSAASNWIGGNFGQAQTDTGTCLDISSGGGGDSMTGRQLTTFNHAMQTCWQLKDNVRKFGSTITATQMWQGINTTDVKNDCDKVYTTDGITANTITNAAAGNYICTSVATHQSPSWPWNLMNTDTTGYVGRCWQGNGNSEKFNGNDDCVKQEIMHYCEGANYGDVIDPTVNGTAAATTSGIPAALIDAGISAVGNPVGPADSFGTCSATPLTNCITDSNCSKVCSNNSATACTVDTNCVTPGKCIPQTCTNPFYVKATAATAPTGLIQSYGNSIRFGVMTFNFNGSTSSEFGRVCNNDPTRTCTSDLSCFPGTCSRDGALMLSPYIANHCTNTTTPCIIDADCTGGATCDRDSVGTHSSGLSLIHRVDEIHAESWTPFAEGFYNAIAYFVKDARSTNSYLPASFAPTSTAIQAPLNSTDIVDHTNPIQYRCQKNNILLITDGQATADQNSTMTAKVTGSAVFRDPTNASPEPTVCGSYLGSPYLHDLSYYAFHRNIFNPSIQCYDASNNFNNTKVCSTTTTTTCTSNSQCPSGETCIKACENAHSITTFAVFNGPASTSTDICDPYNQLVKTAANSNTTLKTATNPQALKTAIKETFEAVAGKSASGTAASILSNSEGSGANILQAVFFPRKKFVDNTEVTWSGELQNLWYYVDPFIGNSSVRENTSDPSLRPANTFYFNLKSDNVLQFYFDANDAATKVKRLQDVDGNGTGDVLLGTYTPDDVNSLWRAGKQLWSRSASSRTIYTPFITGGTALGVSGTGLMEFSSTATNAGVLYPYLQGAGADVAAKTADAVNIINYTRGADASGYRSRSVKIGIDPTAKVWKLGDIISSTPRLQSTGKVNNYNLGYGDKTYGDDDAKTGFTYTTEYLNRGMVYVGANDGMLHAFKLGKLDVTPSGDRKAILSGTNLGEEQWAFVPKNALPYLRYLTCKEGNGDAYCASSDYNHLYTVDGSIAIVDASISKEASPTCTETYYWNCPRTSTSWKTVLIGGMGIGGASKLSNDSCLEDVTGTCVKSPVDNTGYSSYFALDITNQTFDTSGALSGPPKLLWEFTDASLGFATSGVATVRVSARTTAGSPTLAGATHDKNRNGRWFAVFGSGPTGPIDKTRHQFKGTSTQPLKIFVVDLATGTLVRTISTLGTGTATIPNAFVSSMVNSSIDTDRWDKTSTGNYEDDALYFGYVTANSTGDPLPSGTTWTNGGVLRLVTKNDPDPDHWILSKVIDGIGPVTSAVSRLQDRKNHKLWLYFGAGRYFFSQDDMSTQRSLYGVWDPCYSKTGVPVDTLDSTCTDMVTGTLADQTNYASPVTMTSGTPGWKITMDAEDTTNMFGAERLTTDPVSLTNGGVFFTSFKPTSDICAFGGNSYLWGVKYDTGLQAPAAALEGKALIQVSTGEFKEVDLKDILGDGTSSGNALTKGGRRLGTPMTGKPPSDPPPIISKSNLKPVKRIIHIQER